ncbi:tRNA lysidine(34) synthetase TilS [Sutcliffiella rhizosphaerae]|uniref:tRNA(Ile)-lysidine synthase n=1 Tax=Sutcliffiella rhizosphaerae TaxID=2880967 RepID=A0ABM8YTY4_9BACI|nr:tRNA lysidine(34) synthetase TilS [Sutcliffiella rhizosphaerae]CAG9623428.1 tRNA(Ile)-lysidine synthase [Sutcliffiella rhizosphaerae]
MWKSVSTFVDQYKLIPFNSVVVVGVSGGADSMALLHFLDSMKEARNLTLVVAHIDHMFRGKESEKDMMFVKEQCERRNLLFEGEQIDVTSYKELEKISAQVAARDCRYAFFKKVMEKYGASVLALGHHGDDQVETILMRLGRGSSMKGYAGIFPKRLFNNGHIVRPLLSVTKDEVLAYVKENDVRFRHDPSNDKDMYRRNRVRHHVLPLLKQEFPNLHQKFQSFSEQIQEDEQYLEALTEKEWNTVIKSKEKERVVLNRKPLLLMAKPLQRRGIQLILNYLYNNEIPPSLSSLHIDNFLSLLESEHPSGSLHFPKGLQIIRSYHECILTFDKVESDAYKFHLEVPGVVTLPTGDSIISEIWTHAKQEILQNNQAAFDVSNTSTPLYVRTRMEGDRIKLKGTNGSKKLKSIFIDCKIPKLKRDTWPIIVNENNEILWMPMIKRSSFEATEETVGPVLVITCKMSQKFGRQQENE